MTLLPGQNAELAREGESVDLALPAPRLAAGYGLAVMPLDASGSALPDSYQSYADPPAWARTYDAGVSIDLGRVPPRAERLMVCLYSVKSARSLRDLQEIVLAAGGHEIRLRGADYPHAYACAVLADLYRRDGRWKVRARGDGLIEGIEALGRRHGTRLTDSGPDTWGTTGPARRDAQAGGERPDHPVQWTGSGFSVARRLIVTNAHVIEDARTITVAGYDGVSRATPVIVDRNNDVALIRTETELDSPPLPFRSRGGPGLGESVAVLGYPLSGLLSSGPQVTQGAVSSLLGPREDARHLQISAPIQPGSSGGPLVDMSGGVVGIVVASLTNAQNVNFAVRAALAEALVEAAGEDCSRLGEHAPASDLHRLVRTVRKSVWRLEVR